MIDVIRSRIIETNDAEKGNNFIFDNNGKEYFTLESIKTKEWIYRFKLSFIKIKPKL